MEGRIVMVFCPSVVSLHFLTEELHVPDTQSVGEEESEKLIGALDTLLRPLSPLYDSLYSLTAQKPKCGEQPVLAAECPQSLFR